MNTARPMIRQSELLKSVADWVEQGFVVAITAEGVKVMPKAADDAQNPYDGVKLGR